jgi:hypothetical protein
MTGAAGTDACTTRAPTTEGERQPRSSSPARPSAPDRPSAPADERRPAHSQVRAKVWHEAQTISPGLETSAASVRRPGVGRQAQSVTDKAGEQVDAGPPVPTSRSSRQASRPHSLTRYPWTAPPTGRADSSASLSPMAEALEWPGREPLRRSLGGPLVGSGDGLSFLQPANSAALARSRICPWRQESFVGMVRCPHEKRRFSPLGALRATAAEAGVKGCGGRPPLRRPMLLQQLGDEATLCAVGPSCSE